MYTLDPADETNPLAWPRCEKNPLGSTHCSHSDHTRPLSCSSIICDFAGLIRTPLSFTAMMKN